MKDTQQQKDALRAFKTPKTKEQVIAYIKHYVSWRRDASVKWDDSLFNKPDPREVVDVLAKAIVFLEEDNT